MYMDYTIECRLDHSLWAGPREDCPHFGYDPSDCKTCGGCQHYLGMGDWGLSCRKTYLKLVHAFDAACEDFEPVKVGNGLIGGEE
jgi:hypothetical protein